MQISISTNMNGRNLGVPKLVRNLLKKYNASMILPGEQTPVLGPELVVNGDFSNGTTGWVGVAGATITEQYGEAVCVGAGSGTVVRSEAFGVTSGAKYKFDLFIRGAAAYSSVSIGLRTASNQGLWISNTLNPSISTAKNRISIEITPTVSAVDAVLTFRFSATESITIDGVTGGEILSYSDTINGFRTGNWTDSVGTTPATIDGKTGLVIDAAGSMGPELITTPSATGAAIGGPAVTYYTIGTGTITLNKTYEVKLTVSDYVGSSTVGFSNFDAIRVSANGTYVYRVQASNTAVPQVFTRSTNTCTFSNISVRELTGIHALQATDGFKPLERRGLVNLLTYSNDFSNAVWGIAPGFSAISETVAGPYGQSEPVYKITSVTGNTATTRSGFTSPSTQITLAVLCKPGTHVPSILLRNHTTSVNLMQVSASGTGATSAYGEAVVTTLENGWKLVVLRFTSGISVGDSLLVYSGATGSVTVGNYWHLHSAALFTGTVTAQQIIDAGGIPVTTDAPKSSSLGPRYWQFDGVDDRLQLSAVPFQMSDDHWVVVACRPDMFGGFARVLFGHANAGSGRVCQIQIATNGQPQAIWIDDANTQRPALGSVISPGTAIVVSGIKRGAADKILRQDGVQQDNNTQSLGAIATTTIAEIGARAVAGLFYNGQIHCVIYGKGPITDAELLTLERFAAQLQGRSL